MKYYTHTHEAKSRLSELDATIPNKVTDKEIEKEITESVSLEDLTFSEICVPLICSPKQGQFPGRAARSYPYLVGLKLADDLESETQIDILVGAEQYWNFATGGVIRGESGPATIHTKLGWVLSGP